MSKLTSKSKKLGFAITEILVATAIAAGIITTITVGLSSAVRLSATSIKNAQILAEASTISARLNANISESDAIEDLEGWDISRSRHMGRNGSAFDIVTATYEQHKFEFLVRKPTGN